MILVTYLHHISFQPLIDKPTREVNSSSTLLDNIYTNESDSGNIMYQRDYEN